MAPEDPYRAPAASILATADEARLPIEPAGRWRRLFNFIIDYAVSWLLTLVIVVAYVMVRWEMGDEEVLASLDQPNFFRDYALGVLVMLAYYLPMEGLFGLTIGKAVTGTRVVNEQGGRPSWKQVAGRTLARLIPFEPLSLLFSTDDQRRGWHDSLPRTWVVRRR
ncbi:MAG: RDD family protein [Luteimonas sp.]|nr:RDD family protein [Luteimonas sp.]